MFGLIPVPLIVFAVAAVLIWLLMTKTAFGTKIYMLGTNATAARFSGLNTTSLLVRTYMISGIYASLAGLVMLANYNSAKADYGSTYTLLAVLIVVLGGVNPNGGSGRLIGVVLAILILQILSSGLNMFPTISNFYRPLIWGGVLLAVITANHLSGRRSHHRTAEEKRTTPMKTAKDKHVVVGADFAGFPLKEAVKKHLTERGWTVEDLTPTLAECDMYHRVGFLVGSKISEGEFEKALAFCGTGMGVHIAASKCPHVHAAVAETLPSAKRAATANNANLLAMGAFWTAPRLAGAMADAFLESSLQGRGVGGLLRLPRIGFDECETFDYDAYRSNGFRVPNPAEAPLGPEPRGLAY